LQPIAARSRSNAVVSVGKSSMISSKTACLRGTG
jgi:hypothetical protein